MINSSNRLKGSFLSLAKKLSDGASPLKEH